MKTVLVVPKNNHQILPLVPVYMKVGVSLALELILFSVFGVPIGKQKQMTWD
jgi:hypothetical protein